MQRAQFSKSPSATRGWRPAWRVSTRAEWLVDLCIHLASLVAAVVAVAVLLHMALPMTTRGGTVGLLLYGAGLLTMLLASTLYNAFSATQDREWLRRLDHAAIFLMMAGTYTPFALIAVGGWFGLALLTVVWAAALFGAVSKLAWPQKIERYSLALYLCIGWCVLLVAPVLVEVLPMRVIILIGIGGLIYTVGVVFHLWRSLRFNKAVWHGCVAIGTGFHYVAVFLTVGRQSAIIG